MTGDDHRAILTRSKHDLNDARKNVMRVYELQQELVRAAYADGMTPGEIAALVDHSLHITLADVETATRVAKAATPASMTTARPSRRQRASQPHWMRNT